MSLVTKHVVLIHLEPLIEQQMAGLEGVRKTRIHSSMMLTSLQLSPQLFSIEVVCATVITSTLIFIFILKQSFWTNINMIKHL